MGGYESASSFFGEEKVVKFPYRTEERQHGERTIAVRLLAPGGGPAPDLDVNTVEIVNPTGRLVILDRSLQGDCVVIRCKVDPNFVRQADFNDQVRFEMTLRMEAKAKTPIRGKLPKFAGLFKAKIDPILTIRWIAALLDEPWLITKDSDKRPMVLPPDGSAGMRITVWAEELNGGQWAAAPQQYEFTHHMAPGNPNINFQVVKMDPPPESIGVGDMHEDTLWYSVAPLPNKQAFPQFPFLPVDFDIRVMAYRKGIIQRHVRDGTPIFLPGKEEPNLAEVLIPIQLQHEYELEFEVYLKGDPDKIGSYTRRVNGEKVTVNCKSLPRYADATLRWRVTGPQRVFKTQKKKFFTEWQNTELKEKWPPGTVIEYPFLAADIEISQDARSIADPEVDLPIEMPAFEPKFEVNVSKAAIKGDEIDKVRLSVKLVATRKDDKMDAIREWGVTWVCPGGKRADVTGPLGDWPSAKGGATADAEFISEWAQQNKKLSIEMRISFHPECIKEGQPPQEATGSVDVDVIGADPILVLEPKPEYALANGKALVMVRPCLIMFGEIYEKPMEIRDLEYDPDFLEVTSQRPTADVPMPEQQKDQWFLCRFHLDDDLMKRQAQEGGTKVSMTAKPLDSYEKGVPAPGLKADSPAVVHLAPCTITFTAPKPAQLPNLIWYLPPAFSRPQPEHFRTKIGVRVVDANGDGVKQELIQHGDRASFMFGDSAFWDGWGFQVTYKPPTTPKWRADKDPFPGSAFVPPRSSSGRMRVADDGWIWFQNSEEGKETDYFLYDHWATFYSDPIKYLRGQASTLFLEFQAGSVHFPPIELPCGTMPGNSNISVITHTQCKKSLAECKVTLTAGSRIETKTSRYNQATEFPDVSTEKGAEILVERKGEVLSRAISTILGEDPPPVKKTVELIEGQTVDVDVEVELSSEWALTTLCSMSWGLTDIPMLGKFAGKVVPVGALLVGAQLTNCGITDREKVGELLFSTPGYGKGNSRIIAFFGIGLAPSFNLVDLLKAIENNPLNWKAYKDTAKNLLKAVYSSEQAKAVTNTAQLMSYYRATKGAEMLSKLKVSGWDICVPSPTGFTTDVPLRSNDFACSGEMEQLEAGILYASSWGLAHFNDIPYSGMGISTSSWAMATIGISGGIWVGKWFFPVD